MGFRKSNGMIQLVFSCTISRYLYRRVRARGLQEIVGRVPSCGVSLISATNQWFMKRRKRILTSLLAIVLLANLPEAVQAKGYNSGGGRSYSSHSSSSHSSGSSGSRSSGFGGSSRSSIGSSGSKTFNSGGGKGYS